MSNSSSRYIHKTDLLAVTYISKVRVSRGRQPPITSRDVDYSLAVRYEFCDHWFTRIVPTAALAHDPKRRRILRPPIGWDHCLACYKTRTIRQGKWGQRERWEGKSGGPVAGAPGFALFETWDSTSVSISGLCQRPTTTDQRPFLKRKRPSRLLSTAFIYARKYLLSHTLSRAVQSALTESPNVDHKDDVPDLNRLPLSVGFRL